jgi:hypothetical protein
MHVRGLSEHRMLGLSEHRMRDRHYNFHTGKKKPAP